MVKNSRWKPHEPDLVRCVHQNSNRCIRLPGRWRSWTVLSFLCYRKHLACFCSSHWCSHSRASTSIFPTAMRHSIIGNRRIFCIIRKAFKLGNTVRNTRCVRMCFRDFDCSVAHVSYAYLYPQYFIGLVSSYLGFSKLQQFYIIRFFLGIFCSASLTYFYQSVSAPKVPTGPRMKSFLPTSPVLSFLTLFFLAVSTGLFIAGTAYLPR